MLILSRCTPSAPLIPLQRHPCCRISRTINFFYSELFPVNPCGSSHRLRLRRITTRAALTEWREYEEAVKEKDLGRALRFLQEIPIPLQGLGLGELQLQRDWQVLDTCLNADDMRLVATAYAFLKDKGFLNYFGKYRSIGNIFSSLLFIPDLLMLILYYHFIYLFSQSAVLEGPRDVTPTVLESSTGLEGTFHMIDHVD